MSVLGMAFMVIVLLHMKQTEQRLDNLEKPDESNESETEEPKKDHE